MFFYCKVYNFMIFLANLLMIIVIETLSCQSQPKKLSWRIPLLSYAVVLFSHSKKPLISYNADLAGRLKHTKSLILIWYKFKAAQFYVPQHWCCYFRAPRRQSPYYRQRQHNHSLTLRYRQINRQTRDGFPSVHVYGTI